MPGMLVPLKRRRPSPLGDWAGSTFFKMVGETGRRANHVLVAASAVGIG